MRNFFWGLLFGSFMALSIFSTAAGQDPSPTSPADNSWLVGKWNIKGGNTEITVSSVKDGKVNAEAISRAGAGRTTRASVDGVISPDGKVTWEMQWSGLREERYELVRVEDRLEGKVIVNKTSARTREVVFTK